MSLPQPLIILASPHSDASRVAAMLGRHRMLYAVPELNLFVAERLVDVLDRIPGARAHGLLRAVAQLYTGEQTLETVDTARRWLYRRLQRSGADVHREIAARVAPLRLVDKSHAYTDVRHEGALERLASTWPGASYLHLVRHPRAQGLAWLASPGALHQLFALGAFERSARHTTIDPQIDWYRRQCRIDDFLARIPPERQRRLRLEDLLADPRGELEALCRWLGLSWSERTYRAMIHPERCSYAHLGPYGAETGHDPEFLSSPAFRRGRGALQAHSLEGALPWRPDRAPFTPGLRELARGYGYR